MRSVVIVADDTTGANSSGILLKDLGYKCISVFTDQIDMSETAAYAISTNSRAYEAKDAYNSVVKVLKTLNPKNIINKRIDSTIRGNLGSELDGFLDLYPDKKAIVVASFPNSGRTCVNNTLYVHGELLTNTETAKDPKMPVTTSIVSEVFEQQSKYEVAHINLEKVRVGALRNEIETIPQRIIVIDAETNDDIECIANTIYQTGMDIITVDPGPFTYYYAKACKGEKSFSFLGLIGSVTELSASQLTVALENGVEVVSVDVDKLIKDTDQAYHKSILNDLRDINNENIVITTTNPLNQERVDLSSYISDSHKSIDDVSNMINEKVVSLFIEFSNYKNPDCFYTSGGDMTVEFLKQSSAKGMELICEIIPLTVLSKIIGGEFENKSLVSKGGLIGDSSTIMDIIKFVKEGK